MTTAKDQGGTGRRESACAPRPILRSASSTGRLNLTPANAPAWGSDVAAETLRALEIPYIALNPGASYRGFHDSIVNYLGNETPQMLLCLHEEAAVAIAHGYAKVTGKAMAACVHSNVGLFHATMAIFNAWCDRMPIVVLGATGPVDAAKRRPWIDWIHTARDQGAIVRNYTKWDDQPASPAATREALIRATWMANTAPMGPVYINLDAELQEAKLTEQLPPIDVARFMPDATPAPSPELVKQAAALLKGAKHPVIVVGRTSRSIEGWNERIALAETLNAKVITDLKCAAGFPTDHPLHAGVAGRQRDRARGDRGAQGRRRDPRARLRSTSTACCAPASASTRRRRRSSTSAPTSTSTTAGAWTTRRCRRSTCCWRRRPNEAVPAILDGAWRRQAAQARRGQAEGRALQAVATARCASTTSHSRSSRSSATAT